ncbi:MAG TPA: glycine--tRNA ligase [Candidatus Aphodocola excrementigallinarum]|uniref:Glycine--tRNA ligase n=1 Tax=Candidatus Aphodocola excrementigallinarum TaxID=2840670 RepID=A0A9D1LID9_9FIRM|nr:glycine--tRNA ligase [Candidatus Aphodocola excrementigallinarum]
MKDLTMDKIVNLCKQYGFVFPGSEIYDGFANTWDFGPVGVELKNNIKKAWWKRFVQEDMTTYGVDAAILMNPKVWVASGHVGSFSDPKMDCKKCKQRFRADNLIEEHSNGKVAAEAMTNEEMEKYINDNHITCPNCGGFDWTPIKQFKLMFETSRGTVEGEKDTVYLRPETCQGEYVNFLNVQRTMRAKLPFAIAQIGKSFRNEITPGNFLFRTIEFEQMELQKFCKQEESMNFYEDYKKRALDFVKDLGLSEDKLRYHDHDKLAHYAKAACDIQYKFPIGWEELNGIHHRGTWDLSRHSEFSGKKMEYQDPETNEKYIPNVIEYSIGADRLTLAILCEAYDEEKLDNDTREVMHFNPAIAPYKVAILPLVKKYHSNKAKELFNVFAKKFMTSYDETGSIGKRYRRQDVIGTPFCITVDDETLNNNTVTIRDRDTMKQITLSIHDAIKYIQEKIEF